MFKRLNYDGVNTSQFNWTCKYCNTIVYPQEIHVCLVICSNHNGYLGYANKSECLICTSLEEKRKRRIRGVGGIL